MSACANEDPLPTKEDGVAPGADLPDTNTTTVGNAGPAAVLPGVSEFQVLRLHGVGLRSPMRNTKTDRPAIQG